MDELLYEEACQHCEQNPHGYPKGSYGGHYPLATHASRWGGVYIVDPLLPLGDPPVVQGLEATYRLGDLYPRGALKVARPAV